MKKKFLTYLKSAKRRHSSAFRNILLSYDVFCELFNPTNQNHHLVKDMAMPKKTFVYHLALHSAFMEGFLNRFDSEKYVAPNQCEIYEQVLLHMIADISESEGFKLKMKRAFIKATTAQIFGKNVNFDGSITNSSVPVRVKTKNICIEYLTYSRK